MLDFTKIEDGKRIVSDDFDRLASYVCIEIDDTYSTIPTLSLRDAAFNRILKQFFGELNFVDSKLNHCEVNFWGDKLASQDLLKGYIIIKNNNTGLSKKWVFFINATDDSSKDMLFDIKFESGGVLDCKSLGYILDDIIKSIRVLY